MDVFLVPVGDGHDELYCEVAAAEPLGRQSPGVRSTWWTRQVDRFSHALAEAEEERRRQDRGGPEVKPGLWRAILRRISEAVAEQRLLWNLRGADAARLIHADDVSGDRALDVARQSLRRDLEKHRRWLAIDALLMVLCLPLMLIPGPNLPGFYFAFRVVGHYLALRGARQGLDVVAWDVASEPQLTALRGVLGLGADERARRLDEIGAALGLDRLAAFVERVAARPV